MRRSTIALLMTLCAVPAIAGSREFSMFLTDYRHITAGSGTPSGLGTAGGVALWFCGSPNWSAGIEVSEQRYPQMFTKLLDVSPLGSNVPVTEFGQYTSWPVDVMTRYAFVNTSRWTPRVGAGVRYVRAPEERYADALPGGFIPVTEQPVVKQRVSAEISGGVGFRLTERNSIYVDVKRLLRSQGVKWHDPLTRASLGVSWRF